MVGTVLINYWNFLKNSIKYNVHCHTLNKFKEKRWIQKLCYSNLLSSFYIYLTLLLLIINKIILLSAKTTYV